MDAIAENKPADAINVIDEIVLRGHDLRNFCRDLLAHFRDLLITKVAASEELLESAVCTPDELKRQASLFSESDLVRFFHSLAETETKLRTATQPRYQLEIGIVKLMELRGVETINEILSRLSALESGQPMPTAATPKSNPGSGSSGSSRSGTSRPPVSSRSASASFSAAAVAPAMETDQAESQMRALESTPGASETETSVELSIDAPAIERIKVALEKQRKMLLVTVLESATTATLESGELYVEFTPEARHFRDTLTRPENIKLLRDACQQVTGQETGVRINVKDPKDDSEPLGREEEEKLARQTLRASAENNPMVQEMLRKFRGELVEVRRLDSK
jgi:DNA polymerase-3 subunit gamma/tau